MSRYIEPKLFEKNITCPHCHSITQFKWYIRLVSKTERRDGGDYGVSRDIDFDLSIGFCTSCESTTIWVKDELIFPKILAGPEPIKGMPEDVKEDYEEARKIFNDSPIGACALLRLGLQKLMKNQNIGKSGNLNNDIKELVSEGKIDEKVQKALDSLRVIGAEAVHVLELDIRDDKETAKSLFKLMNYIAHKLIVLPDEIDDIYNELPQSKKEGIENRDNS